MSGTIAISPDGRWSAAGWLFDWAVEFLADNVTDPAVASDLREIVEENLGWLSLDDYGPEARAELRKILQDRLLVAAESNLRQTVPNRPAVMELLGELADKARWVLDRDGGNGLTLE